MLVLNYGDANKIFFKALKPLIETESCKGYFKMTAVDSLSELTDAKNEC